jgi:hypothetical protein
VVAMLEPHVRFDPSLAALGAAIDRLAADDIDGHAAGLGDDIRALRRCIDRLEAECARRLVRFSAGREHLADNVVSTVAWLRHECGLSASAAVQRIEVARHLPELPATWAGFLCGDIGFQNAALVARTARITGSEAAQSLDQIFADTARHLLPERMRIVTAHARHCVDPDGSLSDANAQYERRRLHLSQTIDGLFVLDGLLDAEGGAALRTALGALIPPRRDSELTSAQRRADALVELATRALNSGALPTARGVRPHLTLTVPAATLERQAGAPGAELVWAGVVPAEAARRMACDAAVARIDVDACGAPLNAGRTTRTVPPALRRALVLRDRGCRFPGCDRPPEWTDAHHIRHWADHGATSMENLILLCRRHHRQVHEGGWSVRRGETGTIDLVPP